MKAPAYGLVPQAAAPFHLRRIGLRCEGAFRTQQRADFIGRMPESDGKTGKILAVYHVGLNLTAVMFLVRGVTQVLSTPLSSGMSAAISGVAGIGHILLGVGLVLLLLNIKRAVSR